MGIMDKNLGVLLIVAVLLTLLVGAEAFAFAPSSVLPSRVGRRAPRPARGSRTIIAAAAEDPGDDTASVATLEDDDDDYDFDAGFRDRLSKEGGVAGVQAKAARRTIDNASRAAQRKVANSALGAANSAKAGTKDLFDDIGLLSKTDWGLTIISLITVVIVAVGSQLVQPRKSFGELSTREQLERLNTAQQEPEVTFGRAGFKI